MSNLELIKSNHDEFIEKYSSIQDKLQKKKVTELEPTIDESRKVYGIIEKYIKDNKRKLYGGYALNKLLENKDKKLALYGEYDTPDIDCYSPEPMIDMKNLCDILHEAGFKYIVGGAAEHKETYNIFVNFQEYVNFSYVPLNVYNAIRFVEIDGFRVINPWFMMIDFFRMFSDPLGSFWRLEKHHKRYQLLEKHFPLPKITKEIDGKNIPKLSTKTYEMLDKCFNFMATLPETLFTGFYVYDYYIYENKQSGVTTNTKYIDIPWYEVYSTNYVTEAKQLLEFIDTLDGKDDFKYEEFYPLFQFFDYSVKISYKDKPIVYMYGNNKRCIPYKEVPLVNFTEEKAQTGGSTIPIEKSAETIKIASFDQNVLHQLTMLVKVRIDNDNDANDTIYKYINTIVNLRDQYINKNKISKMGDGTIYEHLVSDCVGKQAQPKREKRLEMNERKKQGKSYTIRYEPDDPKSSKFDPTKFRYANSSGNIIINQRYMKLCDACAGEEIVETNDNDGSDEDDELI